MSDENDLRQAIVDACNVLNSRGINQGTAGNISLRHGNQMLISPSATPYDQMTAEMIAATDLDSDPTATPTGHWQGPHKPSTEWRFHWQLLQQRPEISAVVHAHPPFCTSLAILRKDIPACHYMVAAFGGNDVKCAGYATFGSQHLADLALTAMAGRHACLLANHGMITVGTSLDQAMWRAVELEALARQYHQALQIGEPMILSTAEIDETLALFAGYGRNDD